MPRVTSEDEELIAQAERELAQAHLNMDFEKIDDLLHSDYTILQPDGAIQNKETVLASYQQGLRQWDSAKAGNLDVSISGNLALVSGVWTASGQNGQTPFDYSTRFLSMWRKEEGQWQNIAYQSIQISGNET